MNLKIQEYKDKLLDMMFDFVTERLFVVSTIVATTMTIIKFYFPQHYSFATELVTFWLFAKKGH